IPGHHFQIRAAENTQSQRRTFRKWRRTARRGRIMRQDVIPFLDVGAIASTIVDFLRNNFDPLFQAIGAVINFVVGYLTVCLDWLPVWRAFLVLATLAIWRVGSQFTLFVIISFLIVMDMNLWPETMDTLALVIGSTV